MTDKTPLNQSCLAPYTRDVLELDAKFGLNHLHRSESNNLAFFALALAGEVGELVNVVKKILRDGESPELWKQFDEEAVDVLIYFIELLNVAKTDFDAAWDSKHRILHDRFSKKDVSTYDLSTRELTLRRC